MGVGGEFQLGTYRKCVIFPCLKLRTLGKVLKTRYATKRPGGTASLLAINSEFPHVNSRFGEY